MTVSELTYFLGPGLWFPAEMCREERTLMWTLLILALGVLSGSTSALPPWGWSLPNDVTGSCHTGNGDQGITCRIYYGSIFLQGDAPHGCPLASLPEMVWWGPRTGQIPESFPSTAARAQLGIGSEELGNQSSMTVIFMGTLTNLCAWDQTTISKNISKYSFALFCFGIRIIAVPVAISPGSSSCTSWHLAMSVLSLDRWSSDWNGNKGGANEWPNFSKFSQIFVSSGGDILQVAGVSTMYWILHSPLGLIINVVFVFKLGWPFSSLLFRVIPL